MKTIKLLLTITMITLTSFAQNITLNVYSDAKLLLFGDDKGNNAGTLDLLIRSEWQGNGDNYLFVYPQFEYAQLKGGDFRRYSAGVGYTINKGKFSASPSVNYGILNRFARGFQTLEFSGDLGMKISNKITFTILGNITQRKDLQYRWGDNVWRFSGYIGIKYNLK
jgi:hypothetical protein